MYEF